MILNYTISMKSKYACADAHEQNTISFGPPSYKELIICALMWTDLEL